MLPADQGLDADLTGAQLDRRLVVQHHLAPVDRVPQVLPDSAALVEDVGAALAAAHLDASLLVLEITESQLLDDAVGIPQLHRLRELGVTVAVDDFGTGYSSLSYLQHLPVDTLKIDRSFVQALTGSPESLRLVEGIVAMAQALGLDIVAEGVEDGEQLDALRSMACPVGQGYLWARPLAPDVLVERLAVLATEETTRRPAGSSRRPGPVRARTPQSSAATSAEADASTASAVPPR